MSKMRMGWAVPLLVGACVAVAWASHSTGTDAERDHSLRIVVSYINNIGETPDQAMHRLEPCVATMPEFGQLLIVDGPYRIRERAATVVSEDAVLSSVILAGGRRVTALDAVRALESADSVAVFGSTASTEVWLGRWVSKSEFRIVSLHGDGGIAQPHIIESLSQMSYSDQKALLGSLLRLEPESGAAREE